MLTCWLVQTETSWRDPFRAKLRYFSSISKSRLSLVLVTQRAPPSLLH